MNTVVRESHFKVHPQEPIFVDEDKIAIKPVDDSRLTLEQRLAVFDVSRHGGEQMVERQFFD
jgi:antitoxin MazE